MAAGAAATSSASTTVAVGARRRRPRPTRWWRQGRETATAPASATVAVGARRRTRPVHDAAAVTPASARRGVVGPRYRGSSLFFLFFLKNICRVSISTLDKHFAECSIKDTRQSLFADCLYAECHLLSVTLGKGFTESIHGFAKCLNHSANICFP